MAGLLDAFLRVLLFALRIMFPCSFLLVASCTKPTVFPRYMTVADVINNVKCELYLAIWETQNSTWLKGWAARFTVSLQVTRDTSGTGDLTLVVPYMHRLGLFTIVGGGTLDKNSQARMTFLFDAENNLNVFMSKNQCVYRPQLSGRHNLAGETGLRLWFKNVIEGINQARIEKQATGFSYNLEFVTTLDGHIRPSFNTNYPSGRIFRGDFAVNHSRRDDNTLNVAFAPYVKPTPPFAATDLGKALQRIEDQLEKANQELAKAKLEKEAADEAVNKAAEARAAPEVRERTKASAQAAQDRVQVWNTNVRSLESTKVALTGLRASAAAAAVTGRGVSVSTEQQLNTLTTLDAIRDIPRR